MKRKPKKPGDPGWEEMIDLYHPYIEMARPLVRIRIASAELAEELSHAIDKQGEQVIKAARKLAVHDRRIFDLLQDAIMYRASQNLSIPPALASFADAVQAGRFKRPKGRAGHPASERRMMVAFAMGFIHETTHADGHDIALHNKTNPEYTVAQIIQSALEAEGVHWTIDNIISAYTENK
jgi:hypothetical protein